MKTKCSSRMKALLLVLAMVLSLFCVSIGTAHPRFTDVPDSFWASKEIAWAVDKGVVNGTSATIFSPNDKILRRPDDCYSLPLMPASCRERRFSFSV